MSKLSRKRPPSGSDRNTQDMYKIINELVDAVNRYDVSTRINDSAGKPGDVRVGKHPDGSGGMKFYLECRSEEGWHSIELE